MKEEIIKNGIYEKAGDIFYYKDDQLHRKDDPAIELADGSKEWWLNGMQHRADGPAVEFSDGGKEWWINGELHREDGPAVEHNDGGKEWWLNGELHREDGPAIEKSNGTKRWYLNGKQHRKYGPAVEEDDGTKQWWLNGELHREDGPAIEHHDGGKEWYLDSKQLTQEEFNKFISEKKQETSALLQLLALGRKEFEEGKYQDLESFLDEMNDDEPNEIEDKRRFLMELKNKREERKYLSIDIDLKEETISHLIENFVGEYLIDEAQENFYVEIEKKGLSLEVMKNALWSAVLSNQVNNILNELSKKYENNSD